MARESCHCRDYSRSQMLRSAAAQAGKGLPSIEGGMPDPAGTGLSRRSFLFRSAGLVLSVYGATKLPFEALEEGIAYANPADKVLVSIFFDGGIDALNVMAPIDNPTYHALRPNLGLNSSPTLVQADSDPNTRLYWHPSAATKLDTLRQESKLGILPAIGYDDPNQSHFTSRHYYEIGELQVGANTGWLGRVVDQTGVDDNPLQGLSMSGELSPMLATADKPVAAVESVSSYDLWSHAGSEPIESRMFDSFETFGNQSSPAGETGLIQARRATQQTAQVREQLSSFGDVDSSAYPDTELGRQLAALAAIIASPLSVKYVTLSATGTYDTHSDQANSLAGNLGETVDAVYAFQRDLETRALDDKVLINMWSEFGRRPDENGSGTDHGAAGLAFVIGKHAAPGIIGGAAAFPGLTTLDDDDNLLHTSDFRGMYCSLLEDWLGLDPAGIIPGEATLPRYTLID
jgi:uncharacterized protein (DUF1501 family)